MNGEPVDDRLEKIELGIQRINLGRELLLGFVFLIGAHIIAIQFLVPYGGEGNGYAWLPLGGIGTVAVWFACATRPWVQRLTRVSLAIALVAMMCFPRLAALRLPQQRGQSNGWNSYPALGVVPARSQQDSTPRIMLCWLAGATIAAFAVHWFFGMQLVPPDVYVQRKPLSLRSIFLLMVLAALVSVFIRGPNWQNRISFFTNGVTLGVISASAAYGVFSNGKWSSRIAIPLATMTTLVFFDLAFGGLSNMWQGSVFNRLAYVGVFVTTLGVSPVLSFAYLKQLGYRMQVKGRTV